MRSKPLCHPERTHAARKMCANCYNTWLRRNNPKYKQSCIDYGIKHRKTPEGKRSFNNSTLKRRYGLTLEQKEQLLKTQNYMCKLCKKKKFLIVEHNHETGKIRGLTCYKCNNLIGNIENNLKLLTKVFKHLEVDPKEYFELI